MIGSYRDKDTARLAAGAKVRKWELFQRQAEKRLRILDAATTTGDLAALNSNRFEALKGNRTVQYSIRINSQWRICFKWPVLSGRRMRPARQKLKLLTTINERKTAMARTPIHPGEILADEPEDTGLSAKKLADVIDVPPNRLYQLIAGSAA